MKHFLAWFEEEEEGWLSSPTALAHPQSNGRPFLVESMENIRTEIRRRWMVACSKIYRSVICVPKLCAGLWKLILFFACLTRIGFIRPDQNWGKNKVMTSDLILPVWQKKVRGKKGWHFPFRKHFDSLFLSASCQRNRIKKWLNYNFLIQTMVLFSQQIPWLNPRGFFPHGLKLVPDYE